MYGVRGQKYVLFALQLSIHENSPVFKDFFTINFFCLIQNISNLLA